MTTRGVEEAEEAGGAERPTWIIYFVTMTSKKLIKLLKIVKFLYLRDNPRHRCYDFQFLYFCYCLPFLYKSHAVFRNLFQ